MFQNKEYVYTVYKEQSFSKAAKKLYLTQPCLSAMVKKVETRLGVPLFNRNTNPIQLTEGGKVYISCVEQVMKLEQQLESYLGDVRGLKTGRISIGTNNICSSFVLPEIMKKFSDSYPEVQIELHEGNVEYLTAQLKSGALDMVLDNYPVDGKLFTIRRLCEEVLLLAVPKPMSRKLEQEYGISGISAEEIMQGIHLEDRKAETPFRRFAQCPFIILRRGNDTRERFEKLCSDASEEPKVILEVDQLSTAYNISLSGIGATLVSDTLIQKMPISDCLQYYKIDSENTKRELFFHVPKNCYLTLAMQKFMEYASAHYRVSHK